MKNFLLWHFAFAVASQLVFNFNLCFNALRYLLFKTLNKMANKGSNIQVTRVFAKHCSTSS